MTTALQIISSAMKKIQVLTKSETPSSDESADGLTALNALLSSWSNDSLLCYARVTESFPLTGGTGTYSIGPSQTFNTARPIVIVSAFTRVATVDYPLELITDDQYNLITVKTISVSPPQYMNYSNGFPSATLRFWAVPSVTSTLFLTSEKEITSLALGDTVSFPPGWERALTYNLALEMAPEYAVQPDPYVLESARDSLGQIKVAVARNRPLNYEPAARSIQNIYTGYVR